MRARSEPIGPVSTAVCHYEAPDGIPNLRLLGDTRTETVRRFYEQAPFPDYPPRATLSWLRARAERSEFARLLDEAIPGDARVVEIGCGTGQMSLYLARADRVVIGADLTRESLRLGAEAARRFELDQIQFIETDLHHPGLRAGAFDVVYSSGVLHHTPDPSAGIRAHSASCTTGRDYCSRALQRIRAHSSPGPALRRSTVWIPLHPV